MVSGIADRRIGGNPPDAAAAGPGQPDQLREIPAAVGPYQVLELIDRGGMATVYRAYHPALDREVAIKMLPGHFAEQIGYSAQFVQEAETTARLQHRNIVSVYDRGDWMGRPYLVMEYIRGGTLRCRLRRPMPVEKAVRILGPIAEALDYVHGEGTLHRDIKPSNVLIREDGTPVLCDFGLAERVDSKQVPGAGTLMGTPEYMAPERCFAAEQGPAADVYSLAVIAYEMLTGSLPFDAPTPHGLLLAHAFDEVPAARMVNPEVAASVEAVLSRALAKSPADRYSTGAEFVAALEAAAAPRDSALEDLPPNTTSGWPGWLASWFSRA